jgi:hypothetical protein
MGSLDRQVAAGGVHRCLSHGLTVRAARLDLAFMSTDTQVAPPDSKLDEGDHDRFSHYVIGGGEALMKSAVTGEPVVALCGKVWVPSRDPKRYPVCPQYEEIQNQRDPNTVDG